MKYILRRAGHSLETIKLISAMMKEGHKHSFRPPRTGMVIRWGSRVECLGSVIANKSSAIKAASNKGRARGAFEAAKVAIPKTATTKEGLETLTEPLVHRPNNHFGGLQFTLCTKKSAVALLKNGGYVSELIKKSAEYRVHVAHSKIMAIQKKPIAEGEERANLAITNAPWSVLKRDAWKPKMCRMAVMAVSCLGLDFGAVDVIMDESGKYYVLEVNTSPRINSPIVSKKYARYFDFLFRSNTNRPHFDVSSKRSGARFAWTEADFNS